MKTEQKNKQIKMGDEMDGPKSASMRQTDLVATVHRSIHHEKS